MSIDWQPASIPESTFTLIFVKKRNVMKELKTEIIINAPVESVWKVFTDFARYPDWNPFIHIDGKPEVGTRLTNHIYLEGMKPQVFKPKVLVAAFNHEFRWLGRMFIPRIFDGENYFRFTLLPDGTTRLTHGEKFRGILVWPIMRMIGEKTLSGFELMNQALKARVESGKA